MTVILSRNRYQLTVMGMKHTEESIALQAIEFWSTVCEIETELAWEASEVCGF